MKAHFSKRERIIFYVTLGVLAGWLCYAGLYRPFLVKLKDLKREIAAERQAVSRQEDLLKRMSVQASLHQPLLETYRQRESDGAVRSNMLAALQEIAGRNQVRIVDMKPGSVREESSYREFPVSMTLEGGLVDIMHFLFEAEFAGRGLRVNEFRFSSGYAARAELRCQVTVSRIFLNTPGMTDESAVLAEGVKPSFDTPSFEPYEQVFSGRNVFQAALRSSDKPSTAEGEAPQADSLDGFSQRYMITAILVDDRPQAVLTDTTSKETIFISVGSHIDGAVVQAIRPGTVILDVNGMTAEITFNRDIVKEQE